MPQAIHISPIDNVVVALHPIAKGTLVEVDGLSVTALEDIPQGHKMAVKPIKNGENIIKYGYGYCGYLGIAVVVVPFLTVGVYKNRRYIREHGLVRGFAAAQPEAEATEIAEPAAVPAAAK